MKRMQITFMSLALIALVSCKNDSKKVEDEDEVIIEEVVEEVKEVRKEINVKLEPKSDSEAEGKVSISEKDGMVTLEASLYGLDAGTHAIHIHEKADCSSADGKSTGGHWNPTFEAHGKWGAEGGYHKGDIGNFEVGEDGYGRISFTTDEWCIGCGDDKKDVLGKAIIVHQGTDDFKSQPSGAAGARVSCGGIIE